MVEQRIIPEDELRTRVARWMEAGGSAQLAIAALEVSKTQEQMHEALRLDRSTLCQPMTI